ncbi:MAG TPA: hypothetical protein DCL29_02105 [Eubacterium sp.]|nr:hypothetical protein [Eubacterium sp.]
MDIITYGLLHKKIKKLQEEIDAMGQFLGITLTDLEDGDTTNPININNEWVTAKPGDWVILYSDANKQFIFDGTNWHQYGGSTTDYEALLNRPSVNGVILEKDKSFEELGRNDIANTRIKQIIDEQFDLIFGGGN